MSQEMPRVNSAANLCKFEENQILLRLRKCLLSIEKSWESHFWQPGAVAACCSGESAALSASPFCITKDWQMTKQTSESLTVQNPKNKTSWFAVPSEPKSSGTLCDIDSEVQNTDSNFARDTQEFHLASARANCKDLQSYPMHFQALPCTSHKSFTEIINARATPHPKNMPYSLWALKWAQEEADVWNNEQFPDSYQSTACGNQRHLNRKHCCGWTFSLDACSTIDKSLGRLGLWLPHYSW